MADLEKFRNETRAWLAANCPPDMRLPFADEDDRYWGGRNATFKSDGQRLWFERMAARGFSVLRFNFRGVGRSQGSFDHGTGELSDAASALDWAQTINPEARACWVAGFSFGAWIGMQLLMRRPEVEGFISIAPPANLYDFSFLAPCPSSGLIVHGEKDAVVPPKDVNTLVEKLKTQKGIVIDQQIIPGANHFFDGKLEPLMETVTGYLDMRLANVR